MNNDAQKAAGVTLPPIESMVVKGVEQGLADLFDIPSESVLFIASTDRMRIANRVAKMKEGAGARIKYPLAFLSISTVTLGLSEQLHGYNVKSVARHGRYIKLSDDQSHVLKVGLIPVIFDFELTYAVDDYQKAFRFSAAWMAAAIHNRMNFSVTYGGESIDIRALLSESLTTPPREESIDQPNAFEYTSTMRVGGWMSDPHKDGQAQIPMVRPTVELLVEGQLPEDPTLYSTQRQVWKLNQ